MATKPKHKAKTNAKPFVVVLILLVIVAIFIFARPSLMPATQEGERRAGFVAQPETPVPAEEPEAPIPAPAEEPIVLAPSGNPAQYKIISFTNRPTSPKTGETATLTVNVKNVGEDATTETTVEFFIDGALIATETLQPLTNNAADVVSVTWSPTATGTYTAMVKVAPLPGEKFVDDNEEDTTVLVFE